MSPVPLAIPPEFWTRDQVAVALQSRNVGALFHLLRRYRGASQTQIGTAVDLGQGYVSKIMNGHRAVVTIDLLEPV